MITPNDVIFWALGKLVRKIYFNSQRRAIASQPKLQAALLL
ncbi:hypothetical protein [Nostoc sp. LEGE 06077]|nr:hypothetical protein [Nostoc sp. LEGE 06077]